MNTLYFITGNKGKVHEATEKFRPLGINIRQKNLGYPEIQTDTLEDVAAYGVTHIQKQGIDHGFILEDAGIFIDGLQGFPGVYSSYVYHTIGLQGILDLLANTLKCTAVFRSVFAYAEPKGDPHFFIGECLGKILKEEKGSQGFGYDPIFIPDGSDRTFAQMDTSEKNQFSHRGKSLEKLYNFLNEKKFMKN
ncbi:non-canonical purine NTP pyrophosphatase, RdgB/HAM1 family [Thermoplasmatales archaeon ex4572_165]|nr:MAG: non-canonical purine NTP pyrophosphatase, RdgB/HAM1 family [Thermoplasmatales archaeon ex4572_165]RLF59976.1 MAG: non-canonical purine NTP pyrophosphatase, RdgB/HAM1 family [Thermoplasmata archaeon]